MPVNFFLDATDDPLLPDQIPSFDGGQFSNSRANLLQENQSKLLYNCDVDKLGKLRTRRGTILVGPAGGSSPSGVVGPVQGLTSYQTKDYNYIVCAQNGKLWQWSGSAWVQIAMGGTVDNEDIIVCRQGLVNNAAGYPMGTTDIVVDGLPAVAAPLLAAGEKLYFMDNLRTNYYEYTIAAWTPGTNTITLEEPGLVFAVKDNWRFTVARSGKVNNGAGYAAGATTIAIDTYNGEVANGEKFVIKSENITHTISSHTGTMTTSLTFTPGLQAAYAAANATVPVVFAQGNDSLYFSDGVQNIYGWNGGTTFRLNTHSVLDDLAGSYPSSRTNPPTACKILLWFQNRLIASGIGAEPDAIYFSDFFDPSSWDADYQKVRIGGGESDPITGLVAWTDYNLLVFKKNAIYVINLDPSQNPNPDDPTLLVASFAVKQIHKLVGCPAPLSAVQVGGGSSTPGSDVFFMDTDKKVHSIRRVLAAEQQQEMGAAISLPVQDVLDTTNIDHIDRVCAMYHNEHYVIGIPSITAADGGLYPGEVLVYNSLTQSWCGVWTWAPTCFARRTDLGSFSKLIFGDSRGNVLQWMDDLALSEETNASYQDYVGSSAVIPIMTQILTRAITLGDFFSYKTGLNVEFEFDESVAEEVTVKVLLDKVPSTQLLDDPFSSLSLTRLRLPIQIPFVLNMAPDLLRKAFDLQRYGTWRELQFQITTNFDKLAIRSIRMTGFMDTIRLQTLPGTGTAG
jgi:hypothetical protein